MPSGERHDGPTRPAASTAYDRQTSGEMARVLTDMAKKFSGRSHAVGECLLLLALLVMLSPWPGSSMAQASVREEAPSPGNVLEMIETAINSITSYKVWAGTEYESYFSKTVLQNGEPKKGLEIFP